MTSKSRVHWPFAAVVCLVAGVLLASAPRAAAQPLPTPGQLDMSFKPGPLTVRGSVENWMFLYAVAVQPDGKILAGGDFDQVNFTNRGIIARFNPDGSLDQSFTTPIGHDANPQIYSTVYDIAVQPDGRILVAGEFTLGTTRKYLVRLNPDGSLDNSFNANVNALIYRVVLQPDGRIIIGSNSLQTVDGVWVNYLARLNPDGSLETPLGAIGGWGSVFAIALQPDGKIVVGGSFYVMRMNPDGTYDPTFMPPDVSLMTVYAVAVQRDGRVLYGGSRTYSGGGPFLYRANADGTPDGTFTTNVQFGSVVWTIVVEPDGHILIGGEFGRVNGVERGNYARLRADGTLDGFLPEPYDGADWNVEDIAIEPSGHVIIVGSFQYFYDDVLPNEYRTGIARLFDTKYRLSSTPDGTGAIVVDDDLDVYVNGVLIYTDGTAPAGARPPIRFSATPGDQIRLVVRDTYGHCASLSPIYLIDPFGSSTPLDPGFSLGCDRPIPPDPVFDKTFPVPARDVANQPPVASNSSAQTDEDTAVAIALAASDPENDPLSYTIVSGPASGSLSGAAPNVIYTPAPNFSGTDSFTFRVSDGPADSGVATVTITVNAVNDVPTAFGQSVTTDANTAVGIALAATDVENDPLTYEIVAAPAHGTLSGSGANLTYTPAANYSGPDSFTFRARDAQATSNTATITISVTATVVTTSTSVASNRNPSTAGDLVTFTATVNGGTPTGTVTFFVNGTTVGSPVALVGKLASLTTGAIGAGSHSVTARYSGDAGHTPSTSSALTQQVNKTATTTALAAEPSPSSPSQAVVLTATIAGFSAGGLVTFTDGNQVIGTATAVNGVATLSTSTLKKGKRQLSATYAGDSNNLGSTAPTIRHTVK